MGSGKVSKLAALAAASKKKASERNLDVSSQSSNSSVALLDRLSRKVATKQNDNGTHQTLDLPVSEALSGEQSPQPRKGTNTAEKRKRQNSIIPQGAEPEIKGLQSPCDPGAMYYGLTIPLIAPKASPSKFAETMFGNSGNWQRTPHQPLQNLCYSAPRAPDANFDAFAGPSPEDIVVKAQNSKSIFSG